MYVRMSGVRSCVRVCVCVFFRRLCDWTESTSADIVLTGGVVSISWRQLRSEWNETAVYLSLGPIMCACRSVCVCVCYSASSVCLFARVYLWNVYQRTRRVCVCVKMLFVFYKCVCVCRERSKLVRRCLRCEASSPPRPPYGHLETLIFTACVCVRLLSVCVCVCLCV